MGVSNISNIKTQVSVSAPLMNKNKQVQLNLQITQKKSMAVTDTFNLKTHSLSGTTSRQGKKIENAPLQLLLAISNSVANFHINFSDN